MMSNALGLRSTGFVGSTNSPNGRFYIDAVAGNDLNSGAQASPWKSAAAILTHDASVGFDPGDIISFKGGQRHYCANPIDLVSSGSVGNPITFGTYGTGNAILSGGLAITSWTLHDAGLNIWKASFAASAGRPRALYVNGIRCIRATTSTGLPSGTTQDSSGFDTTSSSNPGYLSTWGNPGDIEFVFRQLWSEGRVPVASISTNVITMVAGAWADELAWLNQLDDTFTVSYFPSRIENAYEILEDNGYPGTFYHDRSADEIFLIPPAGTLNPNNAEVIAPVKEQLVTLDSVHDIDFTVGLEFQHTTFLQPSASLGFVEIQANTWGDVGGDGLLNRMTAGVTVTNCARVTFTRSIFRKLGAAGLTFTGSSSLNCSVVGSIFTDISGSGVQIGDSTNKTILPVSTVVGNNWVHNVGLEFPGACGITEFFSDSSHIHHNLVHDLPYTGISVGWGWRGSLTPNDAQDSIIELNRVYDAVLVMQDGAGIYSNGPVQGQIIRENWVSDCAYPGNPAGGGIYLDNGSKGKTVQDNVIHDVTPNTIFLNDNDAGNTLPNGNVIVDNTADGEINNLAVGPHAGNTIVSSATARTTGATLNAGLQAAYQDILTVDAKTIPSLRFWLDGEDLAGDTDTPISYWKSRTQERVAVTAPSSGLRPLLKLDGPNGARYVYSDGVDDSLECAARITATLFGTTSVTMVAVARAANTTLSAPVFDGSGSDGIGIYAADYRRALFGGVAFIETASPMTTNWEVHVLRHLPNSNAMWVNGSSITITSGGSANPSYSTGTLRIFSGAAGSVAEIRIFKRALTDAEIDDLNAELLAKYSLP